MTVIQAGWLKLWAKLTDEALWDRVFDASIKITYIIVLAYIVAKLLHIFISKVFVLRMRLPIQQSERRRKTIERLLKSIVSYVVYFSAIVAVLTEMNVKITGLLAGAGIAGLAIGFGAQSLVKDVITGFFIIFEDQFAVGDYVQVNAIEGTVLEIGLRTTKVKGMYGETHIIPNGMIGDVTNYSLTNSIAYVDFNLPYNTNLEEVEQLINNFLLGLPAKYEDLVAPPTLLGVQSMAAGEVSMRISAETAPLKNHGLARALRKDLKDLFDANNIQAPYPKMLVYDQTELLNK